MLTEAVASGAPTAAGEKHEMCSCVERVPENVVIPEKESKFNRKFTKTMPNIVIRHIYTQTHTQICQICREASTPSTTSTSGMTWGLELETAGRWPYLYCLHSSPSPEVVFMQLL